MQISATIITFNEAHNIKRCLDSLLSVVDEIIVVDSFSQDDTKNICSQYPEVSFYENPFEGHIQQKNYAISKAKYNYILSLDADEALTEKLQEEIQGVKNLPQTPHDAFWLPRLNNYCGKWIRYGGWYPDKKIRLWKKECGRWGGQNPHDKIILNDNVDVGELKSDILHFTTESISTHITQVNKFSEIAADQLMKSKKKPNALFKMLFDPPFIFIKKYIFQLGFLDGFHGLAIAMISAHAKFLKYAKYYQKSRYQP